MQDLKFTLLLLFLLLFQLKCADRVDVLAVPLELLFLMLQGIKLVEHIFQIGGLVSSLVFAKSEGWQISH